MNQYLNELKPEKETIFIGIKLENGRWTVNGNSFTDMTPGERRILGEFFRAYNDNQNLESDADANFIN